MPKLKLPPNRILLIIFVFINILALSNAILHDPLVQYDSWGHLQYIKELAQYHLPEQSDTKEFFSPPLPYAFPAILMSTGRFTLLRAAKLAQLLNVLLSIGLSLILLKICEQMRPSNWGLKIAALLLLGVQTVYFKMFTFPRGEPWGAFLTVLSVYFTLEIWTQKRHTTGQVVGLGISLGLITLSRQWGFFVFPAIITWVMVLVLRKPAAWKENIRPLVVSLALATLIGAPFYLSLFSRYGTLTAFNREPSTRFSFSNQPANFYFSLGWESLFTEPLRPAFSNRFWPTIYSDTWGDYWQFFSVYGIDTRLQPDNDWWFVSGESLESAWLEQPSWLITNRGKMQAYLGRVNVAGLFPSILYLLGLLAGFAALMRLILSIPMGIKGISQLERYFASLRKKDIANGDNQDETRDLTLALSTMIAIFSFVGYAWFLIRYPNLGKGDTIKAGYLLHVFPFLALLAGDFLERIRRRSNLLYVGLLILLTLVIIHNLPAMMTHYVPAEKMISWFGMNLSK